MKRTERALAASERSQVDRDQTLNTTKRGGRAVRTASAQAGAKIHKLSCMFVFRPVVGS